MNYKKIIYWVSTAIALLIFAFSAIMYLTNYPAIKETYQLLGFPAWIIYPSAFLKISGILVILFNINKILREWAYAGFFYDAALALAAHHFAKDGQGAFAIVALSAIIISRIFYQYRNN